MRQPRDYQKAGATAAWHHLHNHPDRNPLVVMPTGSGKTDTMSLLIMGLLTAYPGMRILSLTHVKELVAGNAASLQAMYPQAPVGIYSAGLGSRQIRQVTFAGIDSVRDRAEEFGKIGIVIVDEAHRISDKETTGYQKFFAKLREKNPNLLVIGFTATDYRMGMGKLTDGGFFHDVCFDLSSGEAFVWMLQQHYLLRLVPQNPGFQVDESQVRITGGDYNSADASQAFKDQDILERAVDTMIERGQDRQAWLIFNQSIEDAELVADMFRYKGYPVEAVHSKRGDRDEILAAHRAGKLRGITNQGVLTTGYDDPRIDLIGVLRLTRSPGLWVQMLGRGTRPLWVNHIGHNGGPPLYDINTWEGRNASILASPKQNCLVLDFAGNTTRLGPINYPVLPKPRRGKGGGPPPTRECPQCNTYNHISLKCCEECGYEFPVEQKLKDKAGTAELVFDLTQPLPPPPPVEREYGVFRVDRMIAAANPGKKGKPPNMRVDYFSGVRRFSVWVMPEHTGFPRLKSEKWWKSHTAPAFGSKGSQMPETVAEAVERFAECTKPHYIKVWLNKEYPEVEAFDFVGTAFELPPELGGPPLRLEEDLKAEAASVDLSEERAARIDRMIDDDIPF